MSHRGSAAATGRRSKRCSRRRRGCHSTPSLATGSTCCSSRSSAAARAGARCPRRQQHPGRPPRPASSSTRRAPLSPLTVLTWAAPCRSAHSARSVHSARIARRARSARSARSGLRRAGIGTLPRARPHRSQPSHSGPTRTMHGRRCRHERGPARPLSRRAHTSHRTARCLPCQSSARLVASLPARPAAAPQSICGTSSST